MSKPITKEVLESLGDYVPNPKSRKRTWRYSKPPVQRYCSYCSGPIPLESYVNKKTCSNSCRTTARRKDPKNREKILAMDAKRRAIHASGRYPPKRQTKTGKWADIYAWYTKTKDAPCTDCGNKFPPECMDWDHVRGTKIAQISRLMSKGDIEFVKMEMEKCELVCSNCHRTRSKNRAFAKSRYRAAA